MKIVNMKVTEKDLIGCIKNFPIEIVQRMCEEQVAQGNEFNPKVFQRDRVYSKCNN